MLKVYFTSTSVKECLGSIKCFLHTSSVSSRISLELMIIVETCLDHVIAINNDYDVKMLKNKLKNHVK